MDKSIVYRYTGKGANRQKQTIGMIEKDENPGFWSWSCYFDAYGGIATSKREARLELFDYVKQYCVRYLK